MQPGYTGTGLLLARLYIFVANEDGQFPTAQLKPACAPVTAYAELHGPGFIISSGVPPQLKRATDSAHREEHEFATVPLGNVKAFKGAGNWQEP